MNVAYKTKEAAIISNMMKNGHWLQSALRQGKVQSCSA